jgi:hypothetical protein
MIRLFCDRCGAETTGRSHGSINGVEEADDQGNGTNQACDCFDVVCDDCFVAWQQWMHPNRLTAESGDTVDAVDPHAADPGTLTTRVESSS